MLRLTRHGVAVRFVPMPTVEMFRHQRRVGHKEIRRTHDALLHVYRQHPVAAESAADKSRIKRVEESLRGQEAYPLDVSVVLTAGADLQAAVRTLQSVARTVKGARWELLLLAPRASWYQVLIDQLEGDVRAFSVGDLPREDAFAFGEVRAGGRHVLLLDAGEEVDSDAVLETLSAPPGKARRVGAGQLTGV
jgi:hypothetical protein